MTPTGLISTDIANIIVAVLYSLVVFLVFSFESFNIQISIKCNVNLFTLILIMHYLVGFRF